ncbi:tetraacyldisaccharide 4'-kinase [Rhodobacterales bacterium HKCCE2091]|nr:tetraacyldisaccharide 4'-kinase [Rhodobacterales bacterium HKCCE2091]
MMRAPGFWYRRPGIASAVLSPLGALYARATARRLERGIRAKLAVPVICVGNINAGGTGKTPMVMALAERLSSHAPHIVSRGHGGSLEGPVRVDPARHDAAQVGDEPLLLSGFAPVWVAKDRLAGAEAAVSEGAGLVLLDDGFQSHALEHDLALVVVDAARGFGNGCVIPAGPLREPVAVGLARADAVVSVGDAAAQARFAAEAGPFDLPHLTARLEPLPTGLPLTGAKVLAFAGIGHPGRFFATLRDLGAEILRAIPLGDHQPLTPALIARMEREARGLGAMIVTTEKDAARLPPEFRQKVTTVPVRLRFDDEAALAALLAEAGL